MSEYEEDSDPPHTSPPHMNDKRVCLAGQQQVSPRPSATVVTDLDLRVLGVSGPYFELYGLSPDAEASHFLQLVKSRLKAGWFAISEVFADTDPIEHFLDRVRGNRYFRDFHISEQGAVIDATHLVDVETGIISFDFIPTGEQVRSDVEQPAEIRALQAVLDLGRIEMFNAFPCVWAAHYRKKPGCVPVVASVHSGLMQFLDDAKDLPELSGVQTLACMSIEVDDVMDAIARSGFYAASVEMQGGERFKIELSRTSFYPNGPGIVSGKVEKDYDKLSIKMIREHFSRLTQKEAEVIYLLALGYSLKECAGKTGKAQVTVTLQARHALMKTGERSMSRLLAKIRGL